MILRFGLSLLLALFCWGGPTLWLGLGGDAQSLHWDRWEQSRWVQWDQSFLQWVQPAWAEGEPSGFEYFEYKTRRASADGTGKIYMGREIAQVMGHRAAMWLERPSRLIEERPDLLVQLLNLPPDAVVADIGAGTGLISVRMAQRLPEGKVLAVDVQPEMLDILEFFKAEEELANIEPTLGTEQSPNLPAESIDLAVLVDAYHEFEYPREMMEGIVQSLKPGGEVVLAEYRGENPFIAIKPHHKMTQRQARKEMKAVGLTWEKTDPSLPQQHLMFFKKNDG